VPKMGSRPERAHSATDCAETPSRPAASDVEYR
jgi:hypothetical protein